MEIINELEKERRGIYTGAIGLIRKSNLTFNVPIRTLCIAKKSGKGEIGLGSGIVWDSFAEEEYEETKLKGKFLTEPVKPFDIIETMRVENGRITFLDEHMKRMELTAEFFLFGFNKKIVLSYIKKVTSKLRNDAYRLRIALNKCGEIKHELTPVSQLKADVKVIVSRNNINSNNKYQYFKTTNRIMYLSEHKKYSAKGFFDVLYLNERSEVAEGAITNIFISKRDIISTPPLNAGILSGVYRKHFMKNNSGVRERRLYLQDLLEADKIILTNAVRGEVVVDKLFMDENEFISFNKELS
jgi:para-aminobenzoate synthetase/4-amino-4-deoxychorismate lyase